MSLRRNSKINSCLGTMFLSLFLSLAITPTLWSQSKSKPFTSADLLLKMEHGPWLIMAKNFEGEGAKKKAVQLAAELRTEFGLKAYCLPKYYDYTQTVQGAGFDKNGNEKRMKYLDERVIENCAVLVGDFATVDGTDINDTLTMIKQINPKFFGTTDAVDQDPKVNSAEYRNFIKRWVDKKDKKDFKPGPMEFAFKATNPLLPPDYYKSPAVDKFVRSLNEQKPFNEHNLLDCKGKFTVRVLTLRGLNAYETWGRSDATGEKEPSNALDKAAEQAYLFTRNLRMAGYEAYQFHDREQSIVAVGSFNTLGTTDSKNHFVYDPAILGVVNRFAGTSEVVQSQFGTSQKPRILFDLVDRNKIPELREGDRKTQLEYLPKLSTPFDLVPTPMTVPKLEASFLFNNFTMGK
ncbi:MAG: hypothetical protein ACK56W_06115 [Pirellula sp.]|jgi:hypothetical protein|nr:hypothetical protein [Pirellula sp.]